MFGGLGLPMEHHVGPDVSLDVLERHLMGALPTPPP